LPDVNVSVKFPNITAGPLSSFAKTDSLGAFNATVRYYGPGSFVLVGDTLTGVVRATVHPLYGERVTDSTEVLVRFGPYDEAPPVVIVLLTLPIS
jgi:hypothetical protein